MNKYVLSLDPSWYGTGTGIAPHLPSQSWKGRILSSPLVFPACTNSWWGTQREKKKTFTAESQQDQITLLLPSSLFPPSLLPTSDLSSPTLVCDSPSRKVVDRW